MSTNVPNIQAMQTHGQGITTITSFGGIEGIEYYLDPAAAQVISFRPSRPSDIFGSLQGDLCACTVVNYSKDHFDKENLAAISSEFALRDDVWTQAFLEGEISCHYEFVAENCLQYDTSQQPS